MTATERKEIEDIVYRAVNRAMNRPDAVQRYYAALRRAKAELEKTKNKQ